MLLEQDYEQAQGKGIEDAVYLTLDHQSALSSALFGLVRHRCRLDQSGAMAFSCWCDRPAITTALRRLMPGFDASLPRLPERFYHHLRVRYGHLSVSVLRAHPGATGVTAETAPLVYRFSERGR